MGQSGPGAATRPSHRSGQPRQPGTAQDQPAHRDRLAIPFDARRSLWSADPGGPPLGFLALDRIRTRQVLTKWKAFAPRPLWPTLRSGVRKTSVVDHYRRLHPPRETDTANCQPVLKVTLQPVWKKGSGAFCRNGPEGALHKRLLTPFSKRGLANADLAGRFYLASRGVPDYLMTLVRGAAAKALQRGNEQIEMDDLARIFERCLAQQRVLAEQSNPFIGDLDKAALDRVQAADQTRSAGVGLSPRASGAKRRPATATDYLGGRQ